MTITLKKQNRAINAIRKLPGRTASKMVIIRDNFIFSFIKFIGIYIYLEYMKENPLGNPLWEILQTQKT
jgi:hypothetical protein